MLAKAPMRRSWTGRWCYVAFNGEAYLLTESRSEKQALSQACSDSIIPTSCMSDDAMIHFHQKILRPWISAPNGEHLNFAVDKSEDIKVTKHYLHFGWLRLRDQFYGISCRRCTDSMEKYAGCTVRCENIKFLYIMP